MRRTSPTGTPATAWRPSSTRASSRMSRTSGTSNGLTRQLASAAALDDHRRQAVGRALHLLPVGHLLQQGRLRAGRRRSSRTPGTSSSPTARKFKAAGIDCLTTGTKALWPGAGIFDYMNLRTNGYDFHMELTTRQGRLDRRPRPRDLRRMGQARRAGLHHRQPRRARLAGRRRAAGAGQGRELRDGQLRRRRLQGRRHDQRHARLHAVPDDQPGRAARRRGADRHRSTSRPVRRTSRTPRRSSPTWPRPMCRPR